MDSGGTKFDCLLMMIDHYHNKSDGLFCKLTSPCVVPGYDTKKLAKYLQSCSVSVSFTSMTNIAHNSYTGSNQSSNHSTGGASRHGSPKRPLPTPRKDKVKTANQDGTYNSPSLPYPLPIRDVLGRGEWDPLNASSRNRMDMEEVDSEIVVNVPSDIKTFHLRRDQITIEGDLGAGQFGPIKKGMCSLRGGKKIPVAVETISCENVSGQAEMLTEAELMSQLANPYIVRMIGVCTAESIMFVLELLPLGPLNSYLKQHKDTPQWNVCELMWQVAEGMDYLANKRIVHRNLAARSVLLSNPHTAKIGDFGMSKTLCREENYYEASEAGRWPLKWYAPESIYYWKFDTKSDVWSYGVTLWEATSYGEKPNRRMKVQEVLDFLEDNNRLSKPENCPEDIYDIMIECWKYDKDQRPSFFDLVLKMEYHYRSFKENGC